MESNGAIRGNLPCYDFDKIPTTNDRILANTFGLIYSIIEDLNVKMSKQAAISILINHLKLRNTILDYPKVKITTDSMHREEI